MDGRSSLPEKTLSTSIQICMEEPESELLDPIPAMIFWNVSQVSKTKPRRASLVQIMEQKTTRPSTFLDLEESSDDSNSTGENIISSSEQNNKFLFQSSSSK